jgi:hypothetical protein
MQSHYMHGLYATMIENAYIRIREKCVPEMIAKEVMDLINIPVLK